MADKSIGFIGGGQVASISGDHRQNALDTVVTMKEAGLPAEQV